jgi:hypothetical protein
MFKKRHFLFFNQKGAVFCFKNELKIEAVKFINFECLIIIFGSENIQTSKDRYTLPPR